MNPVDRASKSRGTRLPKLILASASPRRKEILRAAGIPFEALPADISEVRLSKESAAQLARRLAEEKARAALEALPVSSSRPVLGADTIVVVGRTVLGKPQSPNDTARMLRMLSGREHRVLTGVCLLYRMSGAGKSASKARLWRDVRLADTRVRFANIPEKDVQRYVGSGEPFDKAGAYAIQGQAGKWVERIEGCYFNVVGLPIALVWKMLQKLEAALSKESD